MARRLKRLGKALGDSFNHSLLIDKDLDLSEKFRIYSRIFSLFTLRFHHNMSVASYFTNLSKAPGYQKKFSWDLGEKIHEPEWSSFHFDATSSEDSNNSAITANSLTR